MNGALDRVQNGILLQMAKSDAIYERTTSKAKRAMLGVAAALVLFGTVSVEQAEANAGLGGMLIASAIGGIASNGMKDNGYPRTCGQPPSISGGEVAASGAAGSLLGHFIGNGRGNLLATIVGGIGGAVMDFSKQSSNMERSKANCISELNARAAAQSAEAEREQIILYSFRQQNGSLKYITMGESQGINSMRGGETGGSSPDSNATVSQALSQAFEGLRLSYDAFAQKSSDYLKLSRAYPEKTEAARYAVTPQQQAEGAKIVAENREILKNAATEWSNAYNEYAKKRALAAAVADNAANDGFDLSRYSSYLPTFKAPAEADAACSCDLGRSNRFASIPGELADGRSVAARKYGR